LNKKKILITIDWFDPAYKAGGPIISIVKLVENMCDIYDFYILTGARDDGDLEILPGIKTDSWIDWKGMAQVYYVSPAEISRKNIFQILDNCDADIYYIQGVFSLYFSIYPLIWWHQASKEKAIVAARGMFHASALAVKKRKKLVYMYAAKIMGWFHHIRFHSTNPEETVQLRRILGNEAEYAEASNFPRILAFKPEMHTKNENELKLLSVARISPEKNSLFLLDVMTLVKSPIKLTIVGNYSDENYFKQFTKKLEKMPSHVKVIYAGHKIIKELQKYYDSNHVFILPTTGENFGHSIIEALSSGMPCIISKNTPWNGLESRSCGYNLENNVQEYADKIDAYYQLAKDVFAQQASNARAYAEEKIDLQGTRQSYIELFK